QISVKVIPYRLFISVNYCLNNKNFTITILNNKKTYKPGFRYLCDGIDSGIQPNSTAAINNTYNQIFDNKTKYLGIVVLGFDDKTIIHDQISISFHEGYYDAVPEYLSTFM
ncbi:15659_t:CDS:2, partial [Funneliformis geosporum]